MERANVQNVEEETGENYPEPTNPVGPQVIPEATISSVDAILKSILQTDVMKNYFVTPRGFPKEDQAIDKLRIIFAEKRVTFTNPRVLVHIYQDIMKSLDPWNTFFKLSVRSTKTCFRCRKDSNYPADNIYCIPLIANSLRDIKSMFGEFTFENIFKVLFITKMASCKTKGCKKKLYFENVIEELPSVLTMVLHWEYNETAMEIKDTIAVLNTSIDIAAMFKWEGKSGFVNYPLVSMVCQRGDMYFHVAYEQGKWVGLFGSTKQDIGDDWMSVLRTFLPEHIRPVILFYEQDIRTSEVKNKNASKRKLSPGSSVDPKSKGKAIAVE